MYRSPASAPKDIFLTWGACLVLFPLIGGVLFALFDAPSNQVAEVVIVGVVFGFLFGWAFGVGVFLVHRTTQGARNLIEDYRESAGHQPVQEPSLATDPQPEGFVGDRPVMANTYHCCNDRLTTDGYVVHGGPDCQHPYANWYRAQPVSRAFD